MKPQLVKILYLWSGVVLNDDYLKSLQDTEDVDYQLMTKIAEYGIVECCGDDKFGRKTIVCSACRLPNEDAIKNSEFKTVVKFYDCLLK